LAQGDELREMACSLRKKALVRIRGEEYHGRRLHPGTPPSLEEKSRMPHLLNSPPVRWVLGLFMTLLPAAYAVAADRAPTSRPASTSLSKIRIVLVGDSTVTDNAGWGKGFAKCFTDEAQVINLSRGGRSSKSFIAEGAWKKALALKPDYVLIQFGHNDQPGHGPQRETDPQTTYRQYMTQYVDEARAAGIKPVLVTSLSRRQWGPDGKIHSTLQPYADVVKQIAAEKKVPLIDLHARSIELYEKLGKAKVDELSPKKTPKLDKAEQGNKADVLDGTHLNAKGSDVVGPIVAEELKNAVPELLAYIK
jgi:lysophospholipase L1-like esterase